MSRDNRTAKPGPRGALRFPKGQNAEALRFARAGKGERSHRQFKRVRTERSAFFSYERDGSSRSASPGRSALAGHCSSPEALRKTSDGAQSRKKRPFRPAQPAESVGIIERLFQARAENISEGAGGESEALPLAGPDLRGGKRFSAASGKAVEPPLPSEEKAGRTEALWTASPAA